MTRQQRKDARAKDGLAPSMARPYRAVRAVACRQAGLDYHAVSLPAGASAWNKNTRHIADPDAPESWEMTQPNSLGRLMPDAGRFPFPGQTRANGRAL